MSVAPLEVRDRQIRPRKPKGGTDCVYVQEVIRSVSKKSF
jgi:hypothetical protein